MRPPTPLRERFFAKVIVILDGPRPVDDAPCWTWTGARAGGNGGRVNGGRVYGVVWPGPGGKRADYAHRVSYRLAYGLIPPGREVHHRCVNPLCVNPAHLEALTHGENVAAGGNAAKTHCPAGHPYDQANTYWHRGNRLCRACKRDRFVPVANLDPEARERRRAENRESQRRWAQRRKATP